MSVLSKIYIKRAAKLEMIIRVLQRWIDNPNMPIEMDKDILEAWIEVITEAKDQILVQAKKEE